MRTIEKIIDHTGIILTKDAIALGVSKHELYNYLRDNNYSQVSHGVYALPETFEDESYMLYLRCPQGVLSHDEALYHYGFTDREPVQPTITIYTGYGTARLVTDGIKVFTVKKELLEIGKDWIKTAFGHSVPMYDRERTICDLIRSRNHFEIQDFQSALKTYVRAKEKDLNKLMEYAKCFMWKKFCENIWGYFTRLPFN